MEFINGFVEELSKVNSKMIIQLSKEIEKSLKLLKNTYKLDWNIRKRLSHPYYYFAFPSMLDYEILSYNRVSIGGIPKKL
jgi:hypothetical protein